MVKRFQDKTVLILGATSGIGRTTALRFAQEGANVVVGGRNEDSGNEVVRSIEAMDGNGLFVQTDVREMGDLQNAVDRTVGEFGGLDVAFNNAGPWPAPGTRPPMRAKRTGRKWSIPS